MSEIYLLDESRLLTTVRNLLRTNHKKISMTERDGIISIHKGTDPSKRILIDSQVPELAKGIHGIRIIHSDEKGLESPKQLTKMVTGMISLHGYEEKVMPKGPETHILFNRPKEHLE